MKNFKLIKKELKKEFEKISKLTENLTGKSYYEIDLSSKSYIEELIEGFEKLLIFFDKKEKKINDFQVIDLGVGKGWSSYILSKFFGRVLAFDLENSPGEQLGIESSKWQIKFWEHFSKLRNNLAFYFFSGENLPVESKTIDLVTAIAVIEHVSPDDKGRLLLWLNEINRILKNGGFLYLSECPNKLSYSEWLARLLNLPRHKRLFSEKELKNVLQSAGFEILLFEYTHPFLDFYPGKFLKIWNFLYCFVFRYLGKLISLTPLKIFFHHFRVIAVKIKEIS